jgi:hypothetical protein
VNPHDPVLLDLLAGWSPEADRTPRAPAGGALFGRRLIRRNNDDKLSPELVERAQRFVDEMLERPLDIRVTRTRVQVSRSGSVVGVPFERFEDPDADADNPDDGRARRPLKGLPLVTPDPLEPPQDAITAVLVDEWRRRMTRRLKVSPEQLADAMARLPERATVPALAKALGLSYLTVYRRLRPRS